MLDAKMRFLFAYLLVFQWFRVESAFAPHIDRTGNIQLVDKYEEDPKFKSWDPCVIVIDIQNVFSKNIAGKLNPTTDLSNLPFFQASLHNQVEKFGYEEVLSVTRSQVVSIFKKAQRDAGMVLRLSPAAAQEFAAVPMISTIQGVWVNEGLFNNLNEIDRQRLIAYHAQFPHRKKLCKAVGMLGVEMAALTGVLWGAERVTKRIAGKWPLGNVLLVGIGATVTLHRTGFFKEIAKERVYYTKSGTLRVSAAEAADLKRESELFLRQFPNKTDGEL